MVDHSTPSVSIPPFSFHGGSSNQNNHNVVLDTDIANLEHDFKNHPLPLARIKKVMKVDEDVKVSESLDQCDRIRVCHINTTMCFCAIGAEDGGE